VGQHGFQAVHVPSHGGQVEPAARPGAVGLTSPAPSLVPSPASPVSRAVGQHLRGFALRVQLGGDQALAHEERCHPPGIVVVHSLQELLIILCPVLALQ